MRKNDTQIPLSNAVTIRRLGDDDADRRALAGLAERDSGPALEGAVLVAEVEGSLLAAISLADGRVLADPFSRTAELRSLLELRAYQLGRRVKHRAGSPCGVVRRTPAGRSPAPLRGQAASCSTCALSRTRSARAAPSSNLRP